MSERREPTQDPATAAANAAAQAARAAAAAQDAAAKTAAQAPTGLENLTYAQLRVRLDELQNLRATLASRRDALAGDYEGSTGANRDGMSARLQMLDNNIVQYEFQIAAVGREMANKSQSKSGTGSGSGSPSNQNGYSDDDMAGAVFTTFLGTALLTVLLMRRFVRRRWSAAPRPPEVNAGKSEERLDRIEQAVDTIAVEIERVSENQRFMTRLMTETQLGASLAAVRSSTEMAKSAGEAAG